MAAARPRRPNPRPLDEPVMSATLPSSLNISTPVAPSGPSPPAGSGGWPGVRGEAIAEGYRFCVGGEAPRRWRDGSRRSCRTTVAAGNGRRLDEGWRPEKSLGARSYKADFTAVTQALQVAVIEPTINSSELDNELDLTICWVCFFLPKPMNMSTVK